MLKYIAGLVQSVPARLGVLALAALALVCVPAFATDPTITDVGNAGGYISAAITALGTIAGLVLGGFFGFWLVRKTFKWANKIG